jgi:hypothetical protein
MMRFVCALCCVMGLAACQSPTPSYERAQIGGQPTEPGIRVSGDARFGISVRP